MALTLDKLEIIGRHKHLQIRYLTESGGYHRQFLSPDDDVSEEIQEIQDKAKELWTDEIKTAWTTYLAEQEPKE